MRKRLRRKRGAERAGNIPAAVVSRTDRPLASFDLTGSGGAAYSPGLYGDYGRAGHDRITELIARDEVRDAVVQARSETSLIRRLGGPIAWKGEVRS